MIPLFHPPRQDIELTLNELRDTLGSRWWGQGPKVELWEKRFGETFGFKYCVAVNSGTAALHLAYVLAGMKPGTQAILPVLTCSATSHAVKYTGADILYADIRPDTLTLDPNSLPEFRMDATVIVPVHLGGTVADSAAIQEYAQRYQLKIVEDAAQALGSKGVGYGDFTCFSFQAIKSLSTGDGGMLVCKNEDDYKRAKRLRWFAIDREQKIDRGWQAWDRRGITFNQDEVGWKYQCTDIDACLGLSALAHFEEWENSHRRALAHAYKNRLSGFPGVNLLNTRIDESSNWLFMVLACAGTRDALAEHLMRCGIETNVAHIRNDLFNVFGGKRLDLPGMRAVEYRYLCLPINSQVSLADVYYICDTIWGYAK
jgi:dTDP-4-amino-4,6-dideoxygalactose transaminase